MASVTSTDTVSVPSSSSLPGPSEAAFWANRWNNGQTQWHKSDVNQNLLDHIQFLNPSNNSNDNNKRIFVPLCGKSVDLKYLYDQGFIVIGIEFIESAIIDFFNENQSLFPSYHRNNNACSDGSIQSFTSSDGRLSLYRADIFSPFLTPSVIGGVIDSVWDRGSLVAIDPKDRIKYWNKILELGGINKNNNDSEKKTNESSSSSSSHVLKILLNVFSYNQLEKKGPPFSVSQRQFDYLLKGGEKGGEPRSDNEEEVMETIKDVVKNNNYSYHLVTDDWYVITEKDKMRNRVYQIQYQA